MQCLKGGGGQRVFSLSSLSWASLSLLLPCFSPSCHSLSATDDDKAKLIENFGCSKYMYVQSHM